jgi:hypothetical protein
VSDTDLLSSNRASHSIFDTAPVAPGLISTKPLYVEIHPPLEIDFDTIFEEEFFPI